MPPNFKGLHPPCVLARCPNAVARGLLVDGPGILVSPDEASSGETGCAPVSYAAASRDVFRRLALVIGLSLSLLATGMLMFINGFFLSRDDLPYISNGQALPFPPLFPHLDPAHLQLKREEGVYYVQADPGTARGVHKSLKANKVPTPVDIRNFLYPQLDFASSSPELCDAKECVSSWVSVTPFDRVVVLLVDAMRFDFLLWDPEASDACRNSATTECAPAPAGLRPFYRNRIPFVHDLLRRSDADLLQYLSAMIEQEQPLPERNTKEGTQEETAASVGRPAVWPSNATDSSSALDWGGNHFSRLYIFEADPPTATTQRLTGIATGSMPSFFSVRETFSASAVSVDSLLMQLNAAGKTSVAVGDNTWERCFGHLLTRARVFPSLNIQDLHTVDDGVAAELPKQFAKGDWAFLVGHTLGVDHVGHAAVLDSDLMHRKLTEMNGMFKTTLKMALKQPTKPTSKKPLHTLFLAFGDHGMTEEGAHGGGSREEVEAGLLSFSTLPAIISPLTAQVLSPGTRLVVNRLPSYLQNHGAFRVTSGHRTVGWNSGSVLSSPTPALGYGSLRIRQVGLAPTLSLLLGLPIPFNSMGRVIADLVPSVASFVQECAPVATEQSRSSKACDTPSGRPCTATSTNDEVSVARAVRCSDLAYLTQLHHIVAWQQHRAVLTHAALTGNDAVMTDPQFAAAKSRWLRLYYALDKEIKALPGAAHVRLESGTVAPSPEPTGMNAMLSLPPIGSETAETELLSHLISIQTAADGGGVRGEGNKAMLGTMGEVAPSVASALPSLIPYLKASAEFSQEALLANVRQLGTLNILLMLCGLLLAFSNLLILVFAILGLRQPSGSLPLQATKKIIDYGLPETATIVRWLWMSACMGGVIWVLAWAAWEMSKYLKVGTATATDAFMWRQLPVLCFTGALCSVVIPFARCVLPLCLTSLVRRDVLGGAPLGEDEPLVLRQRTGLGFTAIFGERPCFARLWLGLFGGGTFLCYASLAVLCLVPFNDCFVDRECSVVRFLIGIYCLSAGLTAFATPSHNSERTRIVSVEGSAGSSPLQVNNVSSAVFIMFCIWYVVGREEVPLISRLVWRSQNDDRHCSSEGYSRFQILGFHPLRGCKGARPSTLELAIFLIQAVTALIWFASECETKSQQSKPSPQTPQLFSHASQENLLYGAVAWVWSFAILPFEIIDLAGSACLGWLAPPKPWLISAPQWLRNSLPRELMDGEAVKLLPLLNVSLPWIIYATTAGAWLRLVFILCHMKQRENFLSMQQVRRAEAELPALGNELSGCSQMDILSRQRLQKEQRSFSVWRIEVWEYFSYYFFLTAVCPLCMYAVILGRVQLWPLLLCCIKWRLLLFLSRVLVLPPPCALGLKCNCCFCLVTATDSVGATATPCPNGTKTNREIPCKAQRGEVGPPEFFLSDVSVCMLVALLALDTFFATGHRMKFSALPIEAGFIGLLEFHPVWSVVTSFLHTYIVYIICCPLVFMIAFLRMAHAGAGAAAQTAKDLQVTTAPAVVHTTLLMVWKLALRLLIGVTLRHLSSFLSLTVLRNHLFIWDLFAVKFLYDATAVCLTYLLVVATLLIVSIGAKRAPILLRLAA